jgi:Zn/Cd-binding protein ZinT
VSPRPKARKKAGGLSHGGRYYRAHEERERVRKRVETYRIASSAVAFLRQDNGAHPEYSDRWKPRETIVTNSKGRREKVYRLSTREQTDFRAFLRERGWATAPHKSGHVSLELRKKRVNFLVEGLGHDPTFIERNPWGGSAK